MRGSLMKTRPSHKPAGRRRLQSGAILCAAGLALSGCVVYPSRYSNGYGGGYSGGYYAAPAYYAPPVVVGVGVGGGWGWGHGGWR